MYRRKIKSLEKRIQAKSDDGLLIFSDPRGGSTWLAEMLSAIPETAVLWEPLNIAADSPFRRIGFGWRQFIPAEEKWPEAKICFEELFRGGELTRNSVFMERGNLKKYQEAKHLIFKFVNGNALLPWLVNNFCFNYRPVYLIRHPYAVVASQIRHGGWNHIPEKFTVPQMRYNDLYYEHISFFKTLNSLAEVNLAHWCLTNLGTLRSEGNNKKWITVNYEKLVLNPEREMERILKDWKIEMPAGLKSIFRKPSATVRGDSPITGDSQIRLWQNKFDDRTLDKMERVMTHFEVEFYSSKNPYPEIPF